MYYVKSTLLEEDIRAILSYMGYMPELGTAYRLKELVETLQVKMVSFELFLAKVECEQMLDTGITRLPRAQPETCHPES